MRKQKTAITFRRTAMIAGLALLLGACGTALAVSPDTSPDAETSTSLSPTSTTAPELDDSTTTVPPTENPVVVPVPDLSGLSLADARELLTGAGLDLRALPDDVGSAVVFAQDPAPGTEIGQGSVVTVDVHVTPTCNPPDPIAPAAGEVITTVLFECGNDTIVPTPGTGVARIVPEQDGEAIDRIEWTLRSLLAGLTDDERIAGFVSAFDAATANAMNSVALTDGRLVVDFNDAIIVNNMNTSAGMVQFNAELHRNVFLHPGVDSAEFHFNGDCEAWSALFESDGCRVISRADWDQDLAAWDELRGQ